MPETLTTPTGSEEFAAQIALDSNPEKNVTDNSTIPASSSTSTSAPIKLSLENLESYNNSKVKLPIYRMEKYTSVLKNAFMRRIQRPKIGMVHIGVGNFHRAHQLYSVHKMMNDDFDIKKGCYKTPGMQNFGYAGIELRNEGLVKALKEQDCLYTLTMRSDLKNEEADNTSGENTSTTESTEVIGSMFDCVYGPAEFEQALKYLTSDDCKVITITVTEKGYCQDAKPGRLDFSGETASSKDLISDIDNIAKLLLDFSKADEYFQKVNTEAAGFKTMTISEVLSRFNMKAPKTIHGWLFLTLFLRFEISVSRGVTILNCDNLTANGDMLSDLLKNEFFKQVVQKLTEIEKEAKEIEKKENEKKNNTTEKTDSDNYLFSHDFYETFSTFIDAYVCFPNSMVDRITPVYSKEHENYVEKEFNVLDAVPVMSEEFLQFFIEKKFHEERAIPKPWNQMTNVERNKKDLLDIHIVPEVMPYELQKLRILNISHCALAHASALVDVKQYELVHDAVNENWMQEYLRKYMVEAGQTLSSSLFECTEYGGEDDESRLKLEEFKKSYRERIISRFGNAAVKDTVSRLLLDGAKKYHQWLRPLVEDLDSLQKKNSTSVKIVETSRICLVLAVYIHCSAGKSATGDEIKIVCESADKLKELANQVLSSPSEKRKVSSFIEVVLGKSCAEVSWLIDGVSSWIEKFATSGTNGLVTELSLLNCCNEVD